MQSVAVNPYFEAATEEDQTHWVVGFVEQRSSAPAEVVETKTGPAAEMGVVVVVVAWR